MYILNIARNSIFKVKQLLFSETLERKDLMLLANKLIEKITDSRNAKERYQLIIKKKRIKSLEHSQIITYYYRTSKNFAQIIYI